MADEYEDAKTTVDPLVGLPRVGRVVADKYRVTRLVGVGGMGVVLEAWHELLEQKVAIKLLLPALGADEEASERFEREGRTVVKIKSEHVTQVLDVGRLPNAIPFIVMEFLEGSDLAELVKAGGPVSIAAAVDYVTQACEAVAAAHAHGIVHRDLKPENVYVTHRADGSPCVKVLDFGLSKNPTAESDSGRQARALTGNRQVMGTPNYMAPEQWESAHDVGPAADQWALATLLYELLAGVPAFGGTQLAEVCTRVTNMPPPSLRTLRAEVPEALERAILTALEKEASRRFPSLFEFAQAIAPYGSEAAQISLRRIAGILRPSAKLEPLAISRAPAPAGATVPAGPAPLVVQHPAAPPATVPMAPEWPPTYELEPPNRKRQLAIVGAVGLLLIGSFIALLALLWSGGEPPVEAEPAPSELAPTPSEPARDSAPSTSRQTVADEATGGDTTTSDETAQPAAGTTSRAVSPGRPPTAPAATRKPKDIFGSRM